MSTPHYVAVKVGDQYEIRRVDSDYRMKQSGIVAGGLLLGLLGVRRGSLSGLTLLAAGVGLSYYGYTGKNPLKMLGCAGSCPEGSPSYQHDAMTPSEQSAHDSVDEADMESFPASDPPARTSTIGASA